MGSKGWYSLFYKDRKVRIHCSVTEIHLCKSIIRNNQIKNFFTKTSIVDDERK
jgi:hypothetical protein